MSADGPDSGDRVRSSAKGRASVLEKGNLSEVLCKPKIMPIKSILCRSSRNWSRGEDLGKIDMETATIAVANGIKSSSSENEDGGRRRQKKGEVDRLDLARRHLSSTVRKLAESFFKSRIGKSLADVVCVFQMAPSQWASAPFAISYQ